MRVYELAKELGISSTDMMERLHSLGVNATNHMNTVEDAVVEKLRAGKGKVKGITPPSPAKSAHSKPAATTMEHPKKEALSTKGKAVKPSPIEAAQPPKPAIPEKKAVVVSSAPKGVPTAEPTPVPVKAPSAPSVAPPPPLAKPQAPKPVAPLAPPPPIVSTPPQAKPAAPPPTPPGAGKTITLKSVTTVKELAEDIGVRPNQLIAELMGLNILASINERLDPKVAQKIAEKHGFIVEREKKASETHRPVPSSKLDAEDEGLDRPEDLVHRPPIVTILGHVDHGKTSLLDKVRNAEVAKGEFGGITQHIGAYTVTCKGKLITFLDTPGHEAFTAMRSRGANMTDIAVIVIAADDGIMPQTREAIKHAQAAEVTLMVAINKCDLPAANPNKVRQQLAAEGLTTEDWGGTIICCEVSAMTGKGIDHFLEMILLQSEVLDLKANPKRRANGFVVEARLESGMGPTANLLVMNGTIHVGDIILCGPHCGRVRALVSDHGEKIKSAGPSTPVQCLGLPGVPDSGTEFKVYTDEKTAREIAAQRQLQIKSESLLAPKRASLDTLYQQMQKNDDKLELNVILKTDVHGSLEAIAQSLQNIKSDKVSLRIILGAVGNATTNDVLLASASNAIILGFHVAAEDGVIRLAKQHGVEIRLHSIIYELIDQVRDAMSGLLSPIIKEKIMGQALVKQLFPLSKGGVVAGCMMRSGYVTMKMRSRVKRQNDIIYEGSLVSLRRFQNDVSEVREGQECGIRLDNFAAFTPGDIIEVYEIEKIAQTL